jgi:hypothetical protein
MVYCFVDKHVMVSVASDWNGGNRRWQVIHESEKGLLICV